MTQIILIRIKPQMADLLRALVGLTTNLTDCFTLSTSVQSIMNLQNAPTLRSQNLYNP